MNKLKHIAFIMDGNGRWAKSKGKSRNYGHREGVKALKNIIEECNKLGLEVVSFYAFSTENWNRPKDEVNKLLNMIKKFADDELPKYSKKNMRAHFMGDISKLPLDVRESIDKVIESTKNNTGMIINIAINYGARDEIIRAVNNILKDKLDYVDEAIFERYLYTAGLPEPDLVVRTSGEQRLSNFMLYQIAYSELVFSKINWPDFDKDALRNVIDEYYKRDRRFGKI